MDEFIRFMLGFLVILSLGSVAILMGCWLILMVYGTYDSIHNNHEKKQCVRVVNMGGEK